MFFSNERINLPSKSIIDWLFARCIGADVLLNKLKIRYHIHNYNIHQANKPVASVIAIDFFFQFSFLCFYWNTKFDQGIVNKNVLFEQNVKNDGEMLFAVVSPDAFSSFIAFSIEFSKQNIYRDSWWFYFMQHKQQPGIKLINFSQFFFFQFSRLGRQITKYNLILVRFNPLIL